MWGHVLIGTFYFWLRGSLVCRIAVFPWWWIMLVVWRLKDEPPHATGWHRVWIISVMLGCGVVGWLIAGLPTYLRKAPVMARQAYRWAVNPHSVGSRARVALDPRALSFRRGLPRLSH
jgi:hypothetical protein